MSNRNKHSLSRRSLQRCQSRRGLPHRRLLEHRRGELHQGRAVRLQRDLGLRRGRTLGDAGSDFSERGESVVVNLLAEQPSSFLLN